MLELDYPDKERAIWTRRLNWSAQVCEQVTLADLDPQAIAETRRQYAEKNKTKPDRLAELAKWDDAIFLNKAKLTVRDRDRRMTRHPPLAQRQLPRGVENYR